MGNIPMLEQLKLEIKTCWEQGQVAVSPDHVDKEIWEKATKEVALELGYIPESFDEPITGVTYSRVNRGFPVGKIPYSIEAKEWATPSWIEEHSSWNRIFSGEPRGIC